jgi:hypothetical protein
LKGSDNIDLGKRPLICIDLRRSLWLVLVFWLALSTALASAREHVTFVSVKTDVMICFDVFSLFHGSGLSAAMLFWQAGDHSCQPPLSQLYTNMRSCRIPERAMTEFLACEPLPLV